MNTMIFLTSLGKVEPLSQWWHCVLKIQRDFTPNTRCAQDCQLQNLGSHYYTSTAQRQVERKKNHLIDTAHYSKQFCTRPQNDHVRKHLSLLYVWDVVDRHHTFRTWPGVAHFGVDKKCLLQAHASEPLAPGWWSCWLWKLWEGKPSWKEEVTGRRIWD